MAKRSPAWGLFLLALAGCAAAADRPLVYTYGADEGTSLPGVSLRLVQGRRVHRGRTNSLGEFDPATLTGAWQVTPTLAGYRFFPAKGTLTVQSGGRGLAFAAVRKP